MRNKSVSLIVKTAILSAFSIVLYFIKFPLPIFPSFLKIQFSNLPLIIGGFVLGPIPGVLICIIRTLCVLPFSNTSYVGELADFLIGISVSLSSSLIYHKWHTKKGGIIGLVVSSFCWVFVGIIANWLILAPFYIKFFFDGNVNIFIGLCSVIPGINQDNYMVLYLFLGILPFNLLLSILCNTVTYFVYKRISFLFDKMDYKNEKILIVGIPGSGKTHFANCLSMKTSYPVYNLDKAFWKPVWEKYPLEESLKMVNKIYEENTYIMEGNYPVIFKDAISEVDMVFIFDFDPDVCIKNVLNRKNEKNRPDLNPSCIEEINDEFIEYIRTFKENIYDKEYQIFDEFKGKKIVFKNEEDVNKYLKKMTYLK